MTLETQRLILRPWEQTDADNLYKYAKDPDIGPIAGWQPHKNAEESRQVIANILAKPESYAVCLKTDNKAIGAIALKLCGETDLTESKDECELGFWIGKDFWGQGLIPEASRELIRHAFEDIGMTAIWCGYYDGNTKSKRTQEKLGFIYQFSSDDVDVPAMNEIRTGHVSLLTKEEWIKHK